MGSLREIFNKVGDLQIVVVGLARSGCAIARALAQQGARILGIDRRSVGTGAHELRQLGVDLVLGEDYLEAFEHADLVILSSSVPYDMPMVQHARRKGVLVVGELEIASQLCGCPMIAVTGTNGKSTTSALCTHLLNHAGLSALTGGNSSRPLSELFCLEQRPDWIVVEVSSFQLEHLSAPDALVPEIGIWLNLTPDHLDHYGSMEVYAATKRRLFEAQSTEQYGVFCADDNAVYQASQDLVCQKRYFGRQVDRLGERGSHLHFNRVLVPEGDLLVRNSSLLGDHNVENAAAAVLAALCAGAPFPTLQAGLDNWLC